MRTGDGVRAGVGGELRWRRGRRRSVAARSWRSSTSAAFTLEPRAQAGVSWRVLPVAPLVDLHVDPRDPAARPSVLLAHRYRVSAGVAPSAPAWARRGRARRASGTSPVMNQARSSALQVSVGTSAQSPGDRSMLPDDSVGWDTASATAAAADGQLDRCERGQNWAVIASSMLWSRMSAFRMSSVLESLTFQAREASVVPIRR